MLLDFRVANHRSLKDEQELDLRPVYEQGRPATTVAAIFGANASGKSNVLSALRFVHDAVLDRNDDWQRDEGVPRSPFRLDATSAAEPSSFAVELLLDGVRYVYGFTVDDRTVLKEWCHSYPTSRRRTLLRREGQQFHFGSTVPQARSRLLADITPQNLLFMTTVHRTGQEPFGAVADWFRRSLRFLAPGDESGFAVTRSMIKDAAHSRSILELLRAADLGISSVDVKDQPLALTSPGGEQVNSIVVQLEGNRQVDIPIPSWSEIELNERLSGESVRFLHDGRVRGEFTIAEESHGTRVWFTLLGLAVQALAGGWTLVVDEIDSSLHPLLLAEFVGLFANPRANPSGAQLLCTTHSATLLGRRRGAEILQRDQVWFTEKDAGTGASTLYSLPEFSPKLGLNWERRYLGGAVGGVPFIDEERFVGAVSSAEERPTE